MFMRFFVAAFLMCASFSSFSHAQGVAANNIAIVDMHYLMQEAKAAKSIQKQLASVRDAYKDQIAAKEKELREGEKSLIAKKENLSAEDFKAERIAFEKRVVAVQKDVKEKQQKLDKAFTVAMDQLRAEAVKLIANNAKERDASIVLPRQNIIIVDQGLDMTLDILKKLDKNLGHIDLKVE